MNKENIEINNKNNSKVGGPLLCPQDEKDEWLDTEGAAQYLKIPVQSLRNLTSSGKIKYYKLGKSNRFLKIDLKNLLLANPRGAIYGN